MEPKTITTEKGAPSLGTTGDARVNLFFKTVRGVETGTLESLLEASWKEDPLDTLKLIFQTRDCRGGKGEKAIFYASLKWLAIHYPDILTKNLEHIPIFGAWKDVLCLMGTSFESAALELIAKQLQKDLKALPEAKAAIDARKKKKEELISSLELEDKKENKEEPKESGIVGISLCAKWAPTERHKHDVQTKAAKKLAKILFPKSKNPLKEYRKVYLVPLRDHLKVTEVLMCSNNWDHINYQRVPSRCMNLERKAFVKHDQQRFQQFLSLVKQGKANIKGKQMFPHELCNFYMNRHSDLDEVVELQWKTIIDGVKDSGTFQNSIVLSDVSGSMSGVPMQVSIALGLLISEVTAPPFQNVIITFHENPTFHVVEGETLKSRVENVMKMAWGGTTNFQAVFDLILERAKAANLPESSMPKRLFVLSDMQFDAADGGGAYKTNHENIKAKYSKAGYQIPTIIYWNLRANTTDYPVSTSESGVALVSGFSPSLLKLLMEVGEIDPTSAASAVEKKDGPKIDPYLVLRKALDDERYSIIRL